MISPTASQSISSGTTMVAASLLWETLVTGGTTRDL